MKDFHSIQKRIFGPILQRILFATIAFFMALLWISTLQAQEVNLPESILHMQKDEVISGQEAADVIDKMHRGQVASQENYIAHYHGQGDSATYYVSLYESQEQAISEKEKMAEMMREAEHEFSHFMPISVQGKDVYMALDQEQAHYFFARNQELIWLAVDVPVAEDALEDIL